MYKYISELVRVIRCVRRACVGVLVGLCVCACVWMCVCVCIMSVFNYGRATRRYDGLGRALIDRIGNDNDNDNSYSTQDTIQTEDNSS